MATRVADNEEFQRALSALQAGNAKDAARLFQAVLRTQPKHIAALNLLGVALGRLGRNTEAIDSFDRALALAPHSVESWFGRGMTLIAAGRHRDAIASFDRAIAAKPDFTQVHLLRAKLLTDLGRHDDALAGVDKLLVIAPNLAEAWLGRGNILFGFKRYDEALAACDRALTLRPDLAEAWHGRGNALNELKRYDEALAAYDKALALNPHFSGAWYGRANVLGELKCYQDALGTYDKTLALSPDLVEAWIGRGNILTELNRHDEASAAFDRALDLHSNLAEAWLGRGNVLFKLGRYNEALAAYEKALAIDSTLAEAWLGRGNVYFECNRGEEANGAYDKALAQNPDLAEAWRGRGNVAYELRRFDDALTAYDRALALKPALKYVKGERLYTKLQLGDWTDRNGAVAEIESATRAGQPAIGPFPFLSISSSAADQLECARSFAADRSPFSAVWRGEIYSHDRIRVAYLSADFRNQAVGQLAVGLFERHDRSRFETTAISFGPDDGSPLRARIKSAFEHFEDVRQMSDEEVAKLIRRREIDIVVDLMGFTRYCRFNILAHRAAPIQVNYLGYPGTMGADCIDYILADRTIIPTEHFRFYSEQVVWLPDAYQANDEKRRISERMPTREECALPEAAFVFCCFNNAFKIAPDIFDIWMRLLDAKPHSVLWLLEANSAVVGNLRQEAQHHGIAPDRLIFAPRLPLADHLARHRQADLFLDTLPYNAHTTASDALWAGVPVLTSLGSTFAGRVAGSLVKAVGLEELVTGSLHDYEALARKLANDPSFLATFKNRLARNRSSCPLFNTERFARCVEAAYRTMWQRQLKGEKPQAFAVERVD